MSRHILYFPALAIAMAGGATVALGVFYQPARRVLTGPVTYVCAGMAIILFLRMLLDPRCRKAIEAANQELHGNFSRLKRIRLDDPQWGLFGSRGGDKFLTIVRLVLFCELAIVLVFSGTESDLLFLAFSSVAVAMMLSILHLGLSPDAIASGVR